MSAQQLERGEALRSQANAAVAQEFDASVQGRQETLGSPERRHLIPAAIRCGIGRIGWHSFRHTFRTLLDETGAPMKVEQELMRHADIRTTMGVYGKAMDASKREAHGKVVRVVLARNVA